MYSDNQQTDKLKRTLHMSPTASELNIVLHAGRSLFCTQCGTEVEEDESFCYNCGAPLKTGAKKATAVPPYHNSMSVVDKALQDIPDDAGHGQERARILEQYFPRLQTLASRNHEFNVLPNLTEALTRKAIAKFSFEYQTLIRQQMGIECLLGVYYSGSGALYPLNTVMIFTDQCMYACASGHEYYSSFHIPFSQIQSVTVQDANIIICPRSGQGACRLTFSPKYLKGRVLREMIAELAK